MGTAPVPTHSAQEWLHNGVVFSGGVVSMRHDMAAKGGVRGPSRVASRTPALLKGVLGQFQHHFSVKSVLSEMIYITTRTLRRKAEHNPWKSANKERPKIKVKIRADNSGLTYVNTALFDNPHLFFVASFGNVLWVFFPSFRCGFCVFPIYSHSLCNFRVFLSLNSA